MAGGDFTDRLNDFERATPPSVFWRGMATMTVNTRKVSDRRAVRYDSYQDLLDDAERLAVSDAQSLGNWSLGQALGHLSRVMEMSIDGSELKAP